MTPEELFNAQDPFALFAKSYAEVQKHPEMREPTAMALATATKLGQPSLRTVLLKSFSKEEGFVFYTNYNSRKGKDLAENNKAALLFYWDSLFEQIRIQGEVSKVSRSQSEAYWNSRPFDSQVAGWLSRQSQPVDGDLATLYKEAQAKWAGKKIPCPEDWGGFALMPSSFEFWIGDSHRLHTSVRFERENGVWSRKTLFP